jgi:hypothetical protein
MQRGNADDALLRHMYGPGWRTVVGIPPGRRPRHVATTLAGAAAVTCAAVAALTAGRRLPASGGRSGAGRTVPERWSGAGWTVPDRSRAWWTGAAVAAAGWAVGTAEFAAARITPGPRWPREIATMVVTGAVIPPVATVHWLRGWWRGRGARPLGGR